MATRTTGINASARSPIYVDGILLSAMVNNNNQNGSPQWFMVSPSGIDRFDTLYGPYSAAYPGNSFGAATEISTRQPAGFEADAKLSMASQHFSLYGQGTALSHRGRAVSERTNRHDIHPGQPLSQARGSTFRGAGAGTQRRRWQVAPVALRELVDDALITQTSTIPGFATPASFVQNVDRARQRGVELVAERRNAFARGLDLAASITYVDATIVANSSYAATAAGASSVGKRTPYVPAWRATAVATWRPDAQWSHTLAARYSSRVYATVDNSDINPATYQGCESYLVLDARMQYKHDKHWPLAAGIDNINNRKYFLFHPFPQRTVFAELAYRY